ncbi:MAG: response regulator, partial [Pseudomonadota bacterium]
MSEQRSNEYSILGENSDVEILVVEDSPTQALYLQNVLEQAGYKVQVASNGESALEFLGTSEPTLVLSDIVMPGLDGYELCRKIKDNPDLAQVPVILVTSLSDPLDILNGLKS